MGLHQVGPLIRNKYTISPAYLCFRSMDSTNHRLKIVVLIRSWESVDVEGRLYALFTPFYGLRIHGFWYPSGRGEVLEPILHDPEGQLYLRFLGSQK